MIRGSEGDGLRASVSSKSTGAPGSRPESTTEHVQFSFRLFGGTKSFQ